MFLSGGGGGGAEEEHKDNFFFVGGWRGQGMLGNFYLISLK